MKRNQECREVPGERGLRLFRKKEEGGFQFGEVSHSAGSVSLTFPASTPLSSLYLHHPPPLRNNPRLHLFPKARAITEDHVQAAFPLEATRKPIAKHHRHRSPVKLTLGASWESQSDILQLRIPRSVTECLRDGIEYAGFGWEECCGCARDVDAFDAGELAGEVVNEDQAVSVAGLRILEQGGVRNADGEGFEMGESEDESIPLEVLVGDVELEM